MMDGKSWKAGDYTVTASDGDLMLFNAETRSPYLDKFLYWSCTDYLMDEMTGMDIDLEKYRDSLAKQAETISNHTLVATLAFHGFTHRIRDHIRKNENISRMVCDMIFRDNPNCFTPLNPGMLYLSRTKFRASKRRDIADFVKSRLPGVKTPKDLRVLCDELGKFLVQEYMNGYGGMELRRMLEKAIESNEIAR